MQRELNLVGGTTEMMGLRVMIVSVISKIFQLFIIILTNM
jgi:hypothetical protein